MTSDRTHCWQRSTRRRQRRSAPTAARRLLHCCGSCCRRCPMASVPSISSCSALSFRWLAALPVHGGSVQTSDRAGLPGSDAQARRPVDDHCAVHSLSCSSLVDGWLRHAVRQLTASWPFTGLDDSASGARRCLQRYRTASRCPLISATARRRMVHGEINERCCSQATLDLPVELVACNSGSGTR